MPGRRRKGREGTYDTGSGDIKVDGRVLCNVRDVELLNEETFWRGTI